MNIRCPSCQTLFRVDPARIPPSGVRARCARCGNTFTVTADQANAQTPAAAPLAPVPMSAPAAPAPMAAPAAPAPMASAAPSFASPQPAPPRAAPTPPPPAAPPPPPAPAVTPGATPRAPVFGSRDPNARAQRIARALVSDIVAYHGKRRDQFLAAGTLRTEFRDEIMKSWEEYVAQVGLDMAKSTPYFRDALNAILANGQNIF